jgi:peptidoglycan-N-acetylglucosamine deacetylase
MKCAILSNRECSQRLALGRNIQKAHHLLQRFSGLALASLFGTVTHVSTQDKVASLTFDDGPDPKCTPKILDILRENGAKGTFFVVGEQAKRYPELISRIVAEEHALGNHTWDHSSLPLLTMREVRDELDDCRQAIGIDDVTLFRAPYGHMSVAAGIQALLSGYRVIGWNIAAQDWTGDNADTLAGRVIREMQPGSIVLFHDALHMVAHGRYEDRRPTVEALIAVLRRLHGKYTFVTVPELLKRGKRLKAGWFSRPDPVWHRGLRRRTQPDEV